MFRIARLASALIAAWSVNAFSATSTIPQEASESTGVPARADASQAPTQFLASGAPLVPATQIGGPAQPTVAETQARSYQGFLNQIHEPYANQLGRANGAGVTVGVVDSGVDLDNPMLRGRVVAGYNVLTHTTGATETNLRDQIGHGSNVTSILAGTLANAGSPFEGVAPGASIAMAKVFGATDSTSSATVDAGINWLVASSHSSIISLSLGSSTPADLAAMQNGVNHGILFTVALGNEGSRSHVDFPAAYATQAWARGQIIAVGAVDSANHGASFSNWCGSVAADCVVAPGVSIVGAYMASSSGSAQYASYSGTSMATPMVAGEAALIKSQWGFLAAPTIAEVIFASSTHLCSDGRTGSACQAEAARPDPEFGWGLIDVSAAMQPIGGLTLSTSSVHSASVAEASLVTSALGRPIGLKSFNVVAVDNFNRGFSVNLGSQVASTASVPASAVDLFSAFDADANLVERNSGAQHLFVAFGAAPAATGPSLAGTTGAPGATSAYQVTRLAYTLDASNHSQFALGTGDMGAHFFGLEASGSAPLEFNRAFGDFNAPYFGVLHDASHIGYALALNDSTSIRVGMLTEAAQPLTVAALASAVSAVSLERGADRTLASFEIEEHAGAAVGIIGAGVLDENGSLLGSTSSGALNINARTQTSFVTLSGAYALTTHLGLAATASVGHTAGFSNGASLITGSGGVTTSSWRLGFAGHDAFARDDALGLSIGMPTRAHAGALSIEAPIAQNTQTGALEDGSQALNLKPSGIEHDLELAYSRKIGRSSRLSVAFMMRQNPGQDAQAPVDRVTGVRFMTHF